MGVAILMVGVQGVVGVAPPVDGGTDWEFLSHYRYVAPVIALLVLWWKPAKAGVWLIAVAGLRTVVMSLVALVPHRYPASLEAAMVVPSMSVQPFVFVGVIGIAVELYRAGLRSVAVALVGLAVASRSVVIFLVHGGIGYLHSDLLVILTLLFGVAVVVAGVDAALHPAPEPPLATRSGPRVLVAGVIGCLTSALGQIDLFNPFAGDPSNAGVFLRVAGAAAVVAVVVFVIAGARAGVVGVAVGLVLGSYQVLTLVVLSVLDDQAALVLVGTVAGVLLGVGAAATERHWPVGVGGAAAVAVAAAASAALVWGDAGVDTESWSARGFVLVLLVLGVASAVAVVSTLVSTTPLDDDVPAVLVGLYLPVMVVLSSMVSFSRRVLSEDGNEQIGVLLPAAIALAVAAGITAVVSRARPRVMGR